MTRRSETSAGILAFRRRPTLAFLLAHPGGPYWRNKDQGAWSIPKGNVESGDLLACAKREFTEETGLTPTGPFIALTPLRQKSGKMVHAFAMEADFDLRAFCSNQFEMEWPPRSGKRQSFPEIDRVAYFNAATARRKILPGQRAFIDELIRHLNSSDRHARPGLADPVTPSPPGAEK
ncbi:MAG TPA: NUDIX domain-containing protein [Pseudolabrys sp.]|nr:NUDIX domain-containing protein [Pseudolabrys sp.]